MIKPYKITGDLKKEEIKDTVLYHISNYVDISDLYHHMIRVVYTIKIFMISICIMFKTSL